MLYSVLLAESIVQLYSSLLDLTFRRRSKHLDSILRKATLLRILETLYNKLRSDLFGMNDLDIFTIVQ